MRRVHEDPWVATFSVVGCDLDRREWGVAVASKFLAVGAFVPWVEADVGAIATQARIDAPFGDEMLRHLRSGASASDVVELVVEDGQGARRQLGVVDSAGRAESFTASECIPWAGGRCGDCYAVQGNVLVSPRTVEVMAASFESTSARTPLAARLVTALETGGRAGGDRRGRQSASVHVAQRGGGYRGLDTQVDLRVDDHPDPITELQRLLRLHHHHFGTTAEEDLVPIDNGLLNEVAAHLELLGHSTGDVIRDLASWASIENLEHRIQGAHSIDPVVLNELRAKARTRR